jgi:hypothetical protein
MGEVPKKNKNYETNPFGSIVFKKKHIGILERSNGLMEYCPVETPSGDGWYLQQSINPILQRTQPKTFF